jgi:hypothetical protein
MQAAQDMSEPSLYEGHRKLRNIRDLVEDVAAKLPEPSYAYI